MTIISRSHQLVFVHIPKCGGTSVETAFQHHVRWGDFVVGSTPEGEVLHKQVFNKLYGITKHSTAADLRGALGGEFGGMRVATVVREPLKIIESYYRFSKTVHRWIASVIARHNPGMSADAALQHAVELVRAGKLDADPNYDVLLLLSGTVKAGVLSQSFEQFLSQVADDRWSDYLSSYLTGEDGSLLTTAILKLEETDDIESYFQSLVGPRFQLGHDNASVRVETPWPPETRARFYALTAAEYERFGYTFCG